MAHIRNVKLQLPFITNSPYIDSKIMNEKGLIDLRAKLDTFLLRKELDKFTQHLFVIKKKKLHHLMLTPLKTRYSSVGKDKITEINTPKRGKQKYFCLILLVQNERKKAKRTVL